MFQQKKQRRAKKRNRTKYREWRASVGRPLKARKPPVPKLLVWYWRYFPRHLYRDVTIRGAVDGMPNFKSTVDHVIRLYYKRRLPTPYKIIRCPYTKMENQKISTCTVYIPYRNNSMAGPYHTLQRKSEMLQIGRHTFLLSLLHYYAYNYK